MIKLNLRYFKPLHLENEVYLMKIKFASDNLEKFSPAVVYFLYSIFDFVPPPAAPHR